MLCIIIVGAGIGGLAAALSLRRAGHIVNVYERSDLNNEVGAASFVPPNASRHLIGWGIDLDQHQFLKAAGVRVINPICLRETSYVDHKQDEQLYGAGLFFAHRIDLHNALKSMAVSRDGVGVPAKVHVHCPVISYNPQEPSITLHSGEVIHGDIVIGADGIHSLASETVIGHTTLAVPDSAFNSCYRFLIHASELKDDENAKALGMDQSNEARFYSHTSTRRRIIEYPCQGHSLHNFTCTFHATDLDLGPEDYHATVHKSEVLQRFFDFDPRLLAVISKATDVKRWPLLYRAPHSQWRKQKLVLLGDAAHPMLPNQCQAAAQAIEDAVALGTALRGATSEDDLEELLDVYIKVRRGRASVAQLVSGIAHDQTHLVREQMTEFFDNEHDIPTNQREVEEYFSKHNVAVAAEQAMGDFNAAKTKTG